LWSEEAHERWGTDALPSWFEPLESSRGDVALAEKYPLSFMTPNTKNRIHSQFNNLEMIRVHSPRPTLAMCPVDAMARGILAGDRVRVFNERGSISACGQAASA
jgi:anaerobic selenocysteine-containing dehydrogenase